MAESSKISKVKNNKFNMYFPDVKSKDDFMDITYEQEVFSRNRKRIIVESPDMDGIIKFEVNYSKGISSYIGTKINYDEIGFLIKNSKSEISQFHIRGFDFYQSRYIANFDEQNPKILEIYKKNNLDNITTIFSFSNLKKDTIYSLPIIDSDKFSVFGNKYTASKNGHFDGLIDVYFKIYNDEQLGKVAVIDSIR